MSVALTFVLRALLSVAVAVKLVAHSGGLPKPVMLTYLDRTCPKI